MAGGNYNHDVLLYNNRDVLLYNSFRRSLSLMAVLALGPVLHAQAANPQQVPASPPPARQESSAANAAQPVTTAAQPVSGRLVLVLPFDNHSGSTGLDWVGESFPSILNQRLASAGFLPISRDDRMYALDHLGLPLDFKPSRATTLRLAQTLDADFVVIGSYTTRDGRMQAQAQLMDVRALKMSPPLQDSTQIERLLDLENAVAWKLTRQADPGYSVAEATFLAASNGLKLGAFENYIRGQVETDPVERLRHLKQAVQLQPGYAAAELALGKTYFAQEQYDEAATTLAKLPPTEPLALEGGFYLGLSYLYTGKYAKAEDAFAFVATRLPLPEVVNNQGVAASRQGKDAVALFTRAEVADPLNSDYHYNLAVALRHRGDLPAARREVEQSLKLKPNDSESAELKLLLQHGATAPGTQQQTAVASTSKPQSPQSPAGPVQAATAVKPTAAATKPADNTIEPLERISRTYSEASFRQAAFEIDQMRALRMSSLPAATQATQLAQLGQDSLAQGLLLEAERQFQSALSADANSAIAHAGLAQVREQSGNTNDARKEAQTSLQLKQNVAAYLVLARLDLQANNLVASAQDVGNALRVEPRNTAAAGMRQALAARGQQLP